MLRSHYPSPGPLGCVPAGVAEGGALVLSPTSGLRCPIPFHTRHAGAQATAEEADLPLTLCERKGRRHESAYLNGQAY